MRISRPTYKPTPSLAGTIKIKKYLIYKQNTCQNITSGSVFLVNKTLVIVFTLFNNLKVIFTINTQSLFIKSILHLRFWMLIQRHTQFLIKNLSKKPWLICEYIYAVRLSKSVFPNLLWFAAPLLSNGNIWRFP